MVIVHVYRCKSCIMLWCISDVSMQLKLMCMTKFIMKATVTVTEVRGAYFTGVPISLLDQYSLDVLYMPLDGLRLLFNTVWQSSLPSYLLNRILEHTNTSQMVHCTCVLEP